MTDANERGAVPSLKIMSWNVQGINTKLNQPDFIKFCNMFDIFACSEIFNCSKDLLENFFIDIMYMYLIVQDFTEGALQFLY